MDGLTYQYAAASVPSGLHVSPVGNGLVSSYGTAIVPSAYFTYTNAGNTYTYGNAYSAAPSGSYWGVSYQTYNGSVFGEGQRVRVVASGIYSYRRATVASPSAASQYEGLTAAVDDMRVYVADAGNGNVTLVTPDETGTLVMPFEVRTVYVCWHVSGISTGGRYWYPQNNVVLSVERPEDQNEVAAINDQTETLMSTDGAQSGVEGYTGQVTNVYEGLQPVQVLGDLADEIRETVVTTESDSSIVFPGMSLSGFVIPSVSIDPMSLVPESLREPIRMMVTLVFVSAFLSHIWHLIDEIFGIHDYGSAGPDFGNASYDLGPRVRGWDGFDSSIDGDLGF